MNHTESLEEFNRWAARLGMNIETETAVLVGVSFYGYVDQHTGAACQGWLGREEYAFGRVGDMFAAAALAGVYFAEQARLKPNDLVIRRLRDQLCKALDEYEKSEN